MTAHASDRREPLQTALPEIIGECPNPAEAGQAAVDAWERFRTDRLIYEGALTSVTEQLQPVPLYRRIFEVIPVRLPARLTSQRLTSRERQLEGLAVAGYGANDADTWMAAWQSAASVVGSQAADFMIDSMATKKAAVVTPPRHDRFEAHLLLRSAYEAIASDPLLSTRALTFHDIQHRLNDTLGRGPTVTKRTVRLLMHANLLVPVNSQFSSDPPVGRVYRFVAPNPTTSA